MRKAEKKNQALWEKANPVFNTAKTTLFQLVRNGIPYAAAIAKKPGLTADTQKSDSYGMTPEEETETGHSFAIHDGLAGDRPELRLTGRLDSLTAPRLPEVYEKREAAGRIRKVEVDCRALDYLSSAGVRVLLMMRKNCDEGVSLTGVNETVGEILDQTGISGTLTVRK